MIYSVVIILKWQSMMGYNSETKAIFVNFCQKCPFGEVTRNPVWAKIIQPSVL